jgi:hypothetical protein
MVRAGEKERKTETECERSRRACARHLRDLKRIYGVPPPDVAVRVRAIPARLTATPFSSSCTSPGALCAELMS